MDTQRLPLHGLGNTRTSSWTGTQPSEKPVKPTVDTKGKDEELGSEEEATSNEEPKADVKEVTEEQSIIMETDTEHLIIRHTSNSQYHNRVNPDPHAQDTIDLITKITDSITEFTYSITKLLTRSRCLLT
jgi:hypothetical protein